MPPSSSLRPQALLSIAILASTLGTYIALSPPNPNPNPNPDPSSSSSELESELQPLDFLHRLKLTDQHATKIALFPLALLSVYTSLLAYHYPDIPTWLLRHAGHNKLDVKLITWSPTLLIPLSLIFGVGIPLRLISYSSLGTNFTFALARPDGLVTTGLYRYVQHPSYTGLIVLVVCNVVVFGRADGVLACLCPPAWFRNLKRMVQVARPVVLGVTMVAMGTRMRQEEDMLRGEFEGVWERWHDHTARLVPFVF